MVSTLKKGFYFLQPQDDNESNVKKIQSWQFKYGIDEDSLLQYIGRKDVLLVEGVAVNQQTKNNYHFTDLSTAITNENCPLVIDHDESMNSTIGKVLGILPHKEHVEALAVVFGEENIKNITEYELWSKWSISWRIQENSKKTAYCTKCDQEAISFFGFLYCPDHPEAEVRVEGDIEIMHLSFVARAGSPGSGIQDYLSEVGEDNLLTQEEKQVLLNLSAKLNYKDSLYFGGKLSKKNNINKQGGVEMELQELRNELRKTFEEVKLSAQEERELREELKLKENELKEQQEVVVSLSNAKEQLSKKLEESENAIKSLNEEKENIKVELEKTKTLLGEKEQELKEVKEKLEAIEEERARKLQEEKDEVIKSILEFKEKIEGKLSDEDKEDEIEFLNSLPLEKLNTRKERLENVLSELENKEKEEMKPYGLKEASQGQSSKTDLSAVESKRVNISL